MHFFIHDDLSELKKYRLIYLASPYSKYPYGIDEAAHDVELVTGCLMYKGLKVFSPIAHTHHLARTCNLDPFDYSIWQPADDAILDLCDAMLIVQMSGWESSYGIGYEKERFDRSGRGDHIHTLDSGVLR